MENLLKKEQVAYIESNFNLSRNLLSVLFFISLSGIIIGLAGWILSPVFLWKMPGYNFIIITLSTFVLMGFTLAGIKYTRKLRLAYSQIISD